jgi:hypothetical protein
MTVLSEYFQECFFPAFMIPNDFRDYPEFLMSQGLKPKTVDDHIVYIKAVFEANKTSGFLNTNPTENLRRTSVELPSEHRLAEMRERLIGIRKRIKASDKKMALGIRNLVSDFLDKMELPNLSG